MSKSDKRKQIVIITHPTGEPNPYTARCNNPYFDWTTPADTTRIKDVRVSKKRDLLSSVEAG
jgi:hypothetical protein